MSPFEPVSGVPRWRVLYALLEPLENGDVLTYTVMAQALGIAPESRHIMQSAIRRAAREFERKDHHALEPVPNVGYRVVRPEEHATLARQHQRKAGRSLERGHSKVVNVDLSGMEPEARKAFETIAQAFSAQMDFNRRLDIRQKDLEDQLDKIHGRTSKNEQAVAANAEAVAAMAARLEELEKLLP